MSESYAAILLLLKLADQEVQTTARLISSKGIPLLLHNNGAKSKPKGHAPADNGIIISQSEF